MAVCDGGWLAVVVDGSGESGVRRCVEGQAHADRVAGFDETPEQIAVIDDLLKQLAEENPRRLRVVDARYFAGLTEPATAALLGLSERTVSRDWKDARAWLAARMDV